MQHDTKAVANTLIRLARDSGIEINSIKLQKLIYFAHGWHLAITKLPLLMESIEVRTFGIVIPSVHLALRQNGLEPITKPLEEFSSEAGRWTHPEVESDSDVEKLLSKILLLYGRHTTIALSNLTNHAGSPWANCIASNNEVLADARLTRHFASLVLEVSQKNQSFFNIKIEDIKLANTNQGNDPSPVTLQELAEYERLAKTLQSEGPKRMWKLVMAHHARWDYQKMHGWIKLTLEDEVEYTVPVITPRELRALLNLFRTTQRVRYNIASGTLSTDWVPARARKN